MWFNNISAEETPIWVLELDTDTEFHVDVLVIKQCVFNRGPEHEVTRLEHKERKKGSAHGSVLAEMNCVDLQYCIYTHGDSFSAHTVKFMTWISESDAEESLRSPRWAQLL